MTTNAKTVTHSLTADKELVISLRDKKPKKKKKEKYHPFISLGLGDRFSTLLGDYSTMDALDLINQFTKPEQWFFSILKQNLKAGDVYSDTKSVTLTRAEQVKASRAYKALYDKNIVKRVYPKMFMFNPEFIIPMEKRDERIQEYNSL